MLQLLLLVTMCTLQPISDNGLKLLFQHMQIIILILDHFLQHLQFCKDHNEDYELNLNIGRSILKKMCESLFQEA